MHAFIQPFFKPSGIIIKPLHTGNSAMSEAQISGCFFL
jgi:hypothetical protein